MVVGNVGRDGTWVLGSGGNVALGSVGTDGRGGNVGFGRDGIVCSVNAGGGAAGVAKSWRAARLTSMLESDNAMIIDRRKQCLEKAMV